VAELMSDAFASLVLAGCMTVAFVAGWLVGKVGSWDAGYKRGLEDDDARWRRSLDDVPHCRAVPLEPIPK
jgi:hypothetical protein